MNKIIATQLINEQFPEWSALPISPVETQGWDNRSFRLGNDKLIRLPSAAIYAHQVQKEQTWLPRLAPYLSSNIPTPIAQGTPSAKYPYPWSIYQWIDGIPLAQATQIDDLQLTTDLATFISELHQIDTNDGPTAGDHNFHRGGDLKIYQAQTLESINQLNGQIDQVKAQDIWLLALASKWDKKPVWVHGDLSPGNLLVQHNKLKAVIDFGQLCIGDPACDLVMAWTYFNEASRQQLIAETHIDQPTWARAQGWALWKALITMVAPQSTNAVERCLAKQTLMALGVIRGENED